MKKMLPLLLLFVFACEKNTEDLDLTVNIVGTYHINGDINDGVISIDKINNESVTLTMTDVLTVLNVDNITFAKVSLNSTAAFDLNQIKSEATLCSGDYTFSGNGTNSLDSVSLFIKRITNSGSSSNPCSNATEFLTISAKKQ